VENQLPHVDTSVEDEPAKKKKKKYKGFHDEFLSLYD
jgi:hypothetical protein